MHVSRRFSVIHILKTSLSATAALVLLANCSAMKAMDATQEMNATTKEMKDEVKKTNTNMDVMVAEVKKTNGGMVNMNTEVKTTNANMKDMHGEVKKTNEGMGVMIGEVKTTNANMKDMLGEVKKTNDGMATTNVGIHRQTLALALAEMMKPENTRGLQIPWNPIPIKMLPAAKTLAKELTAEELIELVYVLVSSVDKTGPTPADKADPTQYNREKMIDLTAAQAISGLADQEKIQEIIDAQITRAGTFQEEAYILLALRARFLQGVMLNPKLSKMADDQEMRNVTPGFIADAARYAEGIHLIAKSGVDLTRIEYLNTMMCGNVPQRNPEEQNPPPTPSYREFFSFQFNPMKAGKNWRDLKKAVRSLDPRYTDAKSPFAAKVKELEAKIVARADEKLPEIELPDRSVRLQADPCKPSVPQQPPQGEGQS